jgi:hypothetical protein
MTPDPNGTAKEAKPPERRFTVTLTAGGDTLNDLTRLMRNFLGMIEKGDKWCLTGGYGECGEFRVTERPEVTHDSFVKELDAILGDDPMSNENTPASSPAPVAEGEDWIKASDALPSPKQPITAEIETEQFGVETVYGVALPRDPTIVLFDFWSGTATGKIIRWKPRTLSRETGHPYTSIERCGLDYGAPPVSELLGDPEDDRDADAERESYSLARRDAPASPPPAPASMPGAAMGREELERIYVLAEKLKTADPTDGNLEGVLAHAILYLRSHIDALQAEADRLNIEVARLQSDKVAYDCVLMEKDGEIADLTRRLGEADQWKRMVLTARGTIGGRLSEIALKGGTLQQFLDAGSIGELLDCFNAGYGREFPDAEPLAAAKSAEEEKK